MFLLLCILYNINTSNNSEIFEKILLEKSKKDGGGEKRGKELFFVYVLETTIIQNTDRESKRRI